jgi:hypothetical protein
MKRFFNTFTLLLFGIITISLFQLGSLGSSIGTYSAQSIKPTAAMKPSLEGNVPLVEPIIEFEPERVIISEAQIDVQTFSYSNETLTWNLLPHDMVYMNSTARIQKDRGNVVLYTKESVDTMAMLNEKTDPYDIIVYSNSYKAIYIVQNASLSDAPIQDVLQQTANPELTLLICSDSCSEQRFIIKATLKEIEKIK